MHCMNCLMVHWKQFSLSYIVSYICFTFHFDSLCQSVLKLLSYCTHIFNVTVIIKIGVYITFENVLGVLVFMWIIVFEIDETHPYCD